VGDGVVGGRGGSQGDGGGRDEKGEGLGSKHDESLSLMFDNRMMTES
jgi:hypothetical protein